METGIPRELFGVSFSDAGHGHAVGTLGTIIATVDGGSTWSEQAASVKVDDDGVKELLNAVSFP
ncbi:MAG: YCF48-related protein, partial [Acidimicrobiales bacterium]